MRNATLGNLHAELTTWHGARRDVIAPAQLLRMEGTNLVMDGEPVLTGDGVSTPQLQHTTWESFDDGVSGKLGIPRAYLRRMKQEQPELYAANINTWLAGDERTFLVRSLTQDPTGGSDLPIARALLTDSYRVIDNLDVLMASLEGISTLGLTPQISADLSPNRMVVRVVVPEIAELAPELLKGYRSPFSGESGDENPTVFAGLVITNSEVGKGAFSLVPRMVIRVCNNGLTITKDASRAVHLGAKVPEGVVRWSDQTHERNLELVKSQTTDAVKTFLDREYMVRAIRDLQEEAGREVSDPQASIKALGKKLAYSEAAQQAILDRFIDGGQRTAGGLMNAITAAAQDQDTDEAWLLESTAVQAMALAV